MTWRQRTAALVAALVATLALIGALLAWYASPVVPVGMATLDDLEAAIRELQADTERTEAEVQAIIRRLCNNYSAELSNTEACRESDSGDHDEER